MKTLELKDSDVTVEPGKNNARITFKDDVSFAIYYCVLHEHIKVIDRKQNMETPFIRLSDIMAKGQKNFRKNFITSEIKITRKNQWLINYVFDKVIPKHKKGPNRKK